MDEIRNEQIREENGLPESQMKEEPEEIPASEQDDAEVENIDVVLAPHEDADAETEEEIPEPAAEADTGEPAAADSSDTAASVTQQAAGRLNNIAIGLVTDSVKIEAKTAITEGEKEEEEWQAIRRLIRSRGLVWGTVKGVTRINKGTFSIRTEIYGKTVLIPENMFFVREMKEYNRYYGNLESKITDESRVIRIRNSMRHAEAVKYIGALIPFTLIGAERRRIHSRVTDERYYEYSIIGNRKEGMDILQDYWFFHCRKKYSRRKDRIVEKGMIVDNAHVLMVEENGIAVEVLGVETWMDVFEANARHIDDARRYYHTGDTIPVMISKLHMRNSPTEKYVRLTPSARLAQQKSGSREFDRVEINDIMKGQVSRISRNGNYVVILDNGVMANIYPERVMPRCIVNVGDVVVVHIRSKSADHMSVGGVITKIL